MACAYFSPPYGRGGREAPGEGLDGRKKRITLARSLRRNQTDVEQKLWGALRRRQIGGHKFRRQYPIQNYVADFACLEAKLVIELDGGLITPSSENHPPSDQNIDLYKLSVIGIIYCKTKLFSPILRFLH